MSRSKTMSVSNPSFDDLAVVPGDHSSLSPDQPASRKRLSKPVMMGIGCVAAAVAFACGYFVASSGNAAPEAIVASDTDAAMELNLANIVGEHADLKKLSASDMAAVVDAYLEDPSSFEDEFIPKEFVQIMSEIALQEGFKDPATRRRLAAGAPSLRSYRNLATASSLAKASFQKIDAGNYPDPVTTRDDVATVIKDGSRCYIMVQETDSIEDWINNIDIGNDDVKSVNKYTQRDSSCGCEKKRLWWCATYKSCPVHKTMGRAFDGFAKAWNEMRGGIYSRIQSKCSGVSEYVFTGYSRGGGIAGAGAFALWKEGLLPANKMRLVTFGSPRILPSDESDQVHSKFLTERYVLNNDPVPSLPFNWWGYKHFGTHICQSCTVGRNRPYWTNLFGIGDHLNYGSWIK